jgi:uncharacterized iron-regulated membrane protein
MINDSMKNCRYCQVAIDPGIADIIASRQAQVNQAYSDASHLRSAAIAMSVLLVIGMAFGIVFWGFVINFFVVIVLLIRWQMRFNNIITDDPDYPKAKRNRTVAFILLIIAIPLGLILNPFVAMLLR